MSYNYMCTTQAQIFVPLCVMCWHLHLVWLYFWMCFKHTNIVAFFVLMFRFYLLGYTSCLFEFGFNNWMQVCARVEDLDNMAGIFLGKEHKRKFNKNTNQIKKEP